MKNYYVMQGNMPNPAHRDTLEGCKQWCIQQTGLWTSQGCKPPVYAVYYDTGTEPVATFHYGGVTLHNPGAIQHEA